MVLPLRGFPGGWNKHAKQLKMLKCFWLHLKESRGMFLPLKPLQTAFTDLPVNSWNCIKQCTFGLYNYCTGQLGYHLLVSSERVLPLSQLAHISCSFRSSNPGFSFCFCSLVSHFALISSPRWCETIEPCVETHHSVCVYRERVQLRKPRSRTWQPFIVRTLFI